MPIVFVCNSKDIHWNLIRVIRHPKKELQLFEPMGSLKIGTGAWDTGMSHGVL